MKSRLDRSTPSEVMTRTDGTRLAEHPLDAPPVWDGMAAASGRLYLSTADGKVLCLGAKE